MYTDRDPVLPIIETMDYGDPWFLSVRSIESKTVVSIVGEVLRSVGMGRFTGRSCLGPYESLL